jgi:hypothetical protein
MGLGEKTDSYGILNSNMLVLAKVNLLGPLFRVQRHTIFCLTPSAMVDSHCFRSTTNAVEHSIAIFNIHAAPSITSLPPCRSFLDVFMSFLVPCRAHDHV